MGFHSPLRKGGVRTMNKNLLATPMGTPLALTVLFLAGILILFFLLLRLSGGSGRSRRINRRSIKEAIDTLPDAVCFFQDSGTVKLCNRQMHRRFRAMTGKDLQTREEFEHALSEYRNEDPRHNDPKDRRLLLFSDGSALRYEEHLITSESGVCTETILSDVTELYRRKQELEEQTEELKLLGEKLQKLSANVLVLTREREILSGKTRLHDQLGVGLTAIRHFLLTDDAKGDAEGAFRMMKRAVELLENDAIHTEFPADFEEFLMDARAVGVEVEQKGNIPRDSKVAEIFLLAARECLTNSVRHSDASKLWMEITENEQEVTLTIASDGAPLERDVRPMGGLANLKRKTEGAGFTMEISPSPEILLTITVPQEKTGERKECSAY